MATTASSRPEPGAGLPPLATRFRLGPEILPEQAAFLDAHGFLVFEAVASADEIAEIDGALRRIERLWLDEKRRFVNGVPVFWGRIDGKPAVQRFAFSSLFSQTIRDFVRDAALRADPAPGRRGRAGGRRGEGRRRREPLPERAGQRRSRPRLAHRRPARSLLRAPAAPDAQRGAAPGRLPGRERRAAPDPGQPPPGLRLDVLPQALLREPPRPTRRSSRSRRGPAISRCTTAGSGTASPARSAAAPRAYAAACMSRI